MQIPDDKTPLFPASPLHHGAAWNSGAPPNGAPVRAFSIDKGKPYAIPFRVAYRGGVWRNAATGERLAIIIEGWRK